MNSPLTLLSSASDTLLLITNVHVDTDVPDVPLLPPTQSNLSESPGANVGDATARIMASTTSRVARSAMCALPLVSHLCWAVEAFGRGARPHRSASHIAVIVSEVVVSVSCGRMVNTGRSKRVVSWGTSSFCASDSRMGCGNGVG